MRFGLKAEQVARLRAARWLWLPLISFVITRCGIALIAYVAVPLVADSSVPPYHIRPDHVLLDVFGSRWDTGFYLDIATQGYRFEGARLPSVAFFPLLPLLIRAVTPLAGDPLVAGVVIANAALLGASMLVYRLAEEAWGGAVADRAVWYLLIFPTSFFGSAIYSESLFLLGAAGALYAARRNRWAIAAMLGLLTGLSRLMGLIAAPMLAVEWWMQRRRAPSGAGPSAAALLAPLAVVIGMAVFMLYLQWNFGDPLAFAHASEAWGRQPSFARRNDCRVAAATRRRLGIGHPGRATPAGQLDRSVGVSDDVDFGRGAAAAAALERRTVRRAGSADPTEPRAC